MHVLKCIGELKAFPRNSTLFMLFEMLVRCTTVYLSREFKWISYLFRNTLRLVFILFRIIKRLVFQKIQPWYEGKTPGLPLFTQTYLSFVVFYLKKKLRYHISMLRILKRSHPYSSFFAQLFWEISFFFRSSIS